MREVRAEDTYRLLGDQPYVRERDPFGFDELANELWSLILRSRQSTPLTVGIRASWGRGKSSLMGQLKRALEVRHEPDPKRLPGQERIEIRTASFNAWTSEGSDVLEGLIKSVLDAMDPNALRRAMRNERLIGALRIPILLVGGLLRVGRLADEVWERLSVDARARNQINNLVTKAMTDWRDEIVKRSGTPSADRLLVVFIDDLDRCSPENVLKVFEALKLYLEAPGFVFVLGYDEDVISEAILEEKKFSKRVTGRDYIEKIVQIVFPIPRPSKPQMDDALDRYLEESGTEELFDEAERELLVERNGRNPRRIKRFINRFILGYRLDESTSKLDAELLIKLLIFETHFPDFALLFDATARKNPIQEFLDYLAVRRLLRQGKTDDPLVREVFEFYDEDRSGSPQELLQRLDQAVHEAFVRLVHDDAFVSLVETLENPEHQDLILRKVQRREELEVRPVDEAVESMGKGLRSGDVGPFSRVPGSPLADERLVAGARILWIDDHPENNARIVGWLEGAGAHVLQLASAEEARDPLPPDLLLSDIARGDDPEAGFRDLERFRKDGYDGPAIFYARTISGARRARAQHLRAWITNDEAELRQRIAAELARQRPPEGEQPPAAPVAA